MKQPKDRFVLQLRLEPTLEDELVLYKRFRLANHIYNVMVKEAKKRIHKLRRDKEYQDIMAHLSQSKGKYRPGDKQRLRELTLFYGLSEYHFHAYVDAGQSQYKDNIDAFTRQKIATHVWQATADYLFHNGKVIHFHKLKNIKSVEGKSNASGIRYKKNRLHWLGLDIPVRIKDKDDYARLCLKHDVAYSRIVRRWHKHKYRYYLQLVLKGAPPQKYPLDAHDMTKVGIDIGPSTVACVSNKGCILTELGSDIDKIDDELYRLNRRLDRQRRANNPDNYNEDGMIRRNTKGFNRVWKTSRRQQLTQDKIKELYAKRAAKLKQSHNELANRILSLGSDIYIEDMNIQGLAKRSQKTEISETTGTYKRKKRFGKSVSNHAPFMLMTIINNKLKVIERDICKVSTYDTKLSQLNHITGEYIKPLLSERWKEIGGHSVQRDLYSAFLLAHMETQNTVDIDGCFDDFAQFIINHDKTIQSLRKEKQEGRQFPSCMGI